MKQTLFHLPMRGLAALLLSLAALPGQAGTAVERQLEAMATSAPHQRLGSAPRPITVHYVHLKDDYQASQILQADLRRLKTAVALCTEANRRAGKPANPPRVFPDQVLRSHEFEYAAPNRAITYFMTYLVQMDDDCSLIELANVKAKLHSGKGTCQIDLDRKTAEGVCDAGGHADAPVPPRPDPAGMEAAMAALAADPRMAKQMAIVRQLQSPAAMAKGPRRTIAGFECRMDAPLPGIRGCISQAGSFAPASSAGMGMTLYREFAKYTATAVEAKFDLPLAPAIFTPYLGGGYTITSKGGR